MKKKWRKLTVTNPEGFLKSMIEHLPRFQREFVGAMVTGLFRAQSVMLSEIGRSLSEPIPLIHTERRLSRNLSQRSLDLNSVHSQYLKEIAPWIQPDTLIAVDIGDISKLYSKHLANLCTVRDGSCPKEDKLSPGWWLVEVEAFNGETHLPLQLELWSQKARGFKSQNTLVMNILDNLISHLGNSGIYLHDAGFDDEKYYTFYRERACRYVIRCDGQGHVCPVSDPYPFSSD